MHIIIVGGGFAGRQAAHNLASLKRKLPGTSITLFDLYPYTTMLPALPWIVSGDFGVDAITEKMERKLPPGVDFRREGVARIDLRKKTVATAAGEYGYDYLVIACGAVTNLHGFNQSLEAVYTLDSAAEAQRMACALFVHLQGSARPICVIVGGSYTGVELACKVYALAKRYGKRIEVVIVEAGREALALVDGKTRGYALAHLQALGFRVITGSTVESFDGKNVRLKTGEIFSDAFLCWCAGTTRAIAGIDGDFEALPDGRIVVNEFLQIPRHPEVFVPADTGAVRDRGQYIRKAVNFAFYAGERAGGNIRRLAEGKPLRPFRPRDLGEVLPLYDTSAGVILGKFITGRLGLRLHYFMTGYRNFSAANRLEFFARALAPSD